MAYGEGQAAQIKKQLCQLQVSHSNLVLAQEAAYLQHIREMKELKALMDFSEQQRKHSRLKLKRRVYKQAQQISDQVDAIDTVLNSLGQRLNENEIPLIEKVFEHFDLLIVPTTELVYLYHKHLDEGTGDESDGSQAQDRPSSASARSEFKKSRGRDFSRSGGRQYISEIDPKTRIEAQEHLLTLSNSQERPQSNRGQKQGAGQVDPQSFGVNIRGGASVSHLDKQSLAIFNPRNSVSSDLPKTVKDAIEKKPVPDKLRKHTFNYDLVDSSQAGALQQPVCRDVRREEVHKARRETNGKDLPMLIRDYILEDRGKSLYLGDSFADLPSPIALQASLDRLFLSSHSGGAQTAKERDKQNKKAERLYDDDGSRGQSLENHHIKIENDDKIGQITRVMKQDLDFALKTLEKDLFEVKSTLEAGGTGHKSLGSRRYSRSRRTSFPEMPADHGRMSVELEMSDIASCMMQLCTEAEIMFPKGESTSGVDRSSEVCDPAYESPKASCNRLIPNQKPVAETVLPGNIATNDGPSVETKPKATIELGTNEFKFFNFMPDGTFQHEHQQRQDLTRQLNQVKPKANMDRDLNPADFMRYAQSASEQSAMKMISKQRNPKLLLSDQSKQQSLPSPRLGPPPSSDLPQVQEAKQHPIKDFRIPPTAQPLVTVAPKQQRAYATRSLDAASSHPQQLDYKHPKRVLKSIDQREKISGIAGRAAAAMLFKHSAWQHQQLTVPKKVTSPQRNPKVAFKNYNSEAYAHQHSLAGPTSSAPSQNSSRFFQGNQQAALSKHGKVRFAIGVASAAVANDSALQVQRSERAIQPAHQSMKLLNAATPNAKYFNMNYLGSQSRSKKAHQQVVAPQSQRESSSSKLSRITTTYQSQQQTKTAAGTSYQRRQVNQNSQSRVKRSKSKSNLLGKKEHAKSTPAASAIKLPEVQPQ